MNIKRILCPCDFSEFSEAANNYASLLAHATEGRIVFLHVAQPEVPYASYAYVDVEYDEQAARMELEKIKPAADGVDAEYAVEFGEPAERIVDYARQHDIDLIVVGTHGRTGLQRLLMGSVAEAVVRKAHCPVLAVKPNCQVPLAY